MNHGNKIPELRFRDFKDRWESKPLSELMEFKNGINASKEQYGRGVKFINVLDILNNDYITYDRILGLVDVDEVTLQNNLVAFGDVLFQRSSETPEDVGRANVYLDTERKATFGGFVIRGQKIGEYDARFLNFLLGTKSARHEIIKKSGGSTRFNVGQETLKSVEVNLPTIPEQQKIASFLASLDTKFQQLTKKKELLEQYKKGVMQKIFKQGIRFKDEKGRNYPKWEEKALSEVLFEHKTKSAGNEEVFSVSVHKGLINQIEHLGRSFAAESTAHYNLVKPNDIVYTKSPTGNFPYGIIKQSWLRKNVIVSPLYGVFTPQTAELGYMLNVYFESPINVYNYLHPIIQKGAKNTINITNAIFLSRKLKLPSSKEEQLKIGSFFKAIDSQIHQVNCQIEGVKQFRKGLLQQMFV